MFPKCFLATSMLVLIFPFVSFAGGGDTGGGNVIQTARHVISEDQVRELVTDATILLPRLLRTVELQFSELQFDPCDSREGGGLLCIQADSAIAEVFRDQKIYSIVRQLRFVPQTQACTDKYGQPADASVYGMNTKDVCVSTGRLAAKYNALTFPQNKALIETIGLLAHESFHKAGIADEKLVRMIQRTMVKAFGTTKAFRDANRDMGSSVEHVRNFEITTVNAAATYLRQVEGHVAQITTMNDPEEACDKLTTVLGWLHELIAFSTKPDGKFYGSVNLQAYQGVLTAQATAFLSQSYCRSEASLNRLGESDDARLGELTRLIPTGSSANLKLVYDENLPSVDVQRVSRGDRSNFTVQIQLLRARLLSAATLVERN